MLIKRLLIPFSIVAMLHSCQKKMLLPTDFSQATIIEEKYYDSLYYKAINGENDSLNRNMLLRLGQGYENIQLSSKAIISYHKAVDWSIKEKDSISEAESYWYLGDLYEGKQVLDSAFYYFVQSEKLYAHLPNDSLNWGRLILYKGGILYEKGIFSESVEQTLKALTIFKRLNDTRLIYEANVQLMLNLESQKEFDAALKYYKNIPTLLDQLEKEGYDQNKLESSWLSYYNNLGAFYNKTKQYNFAASSIKTGLSKEYINNYEILHGMLLNNYAFSLMNTSKNFVLIDSLLNQALSIRKTIDHKSGIISSKFNIAKLFLLKGDTIKGLNGMREVYQMASEQNSSYDVLNSLEQLSQIDKQNANFYTSRYHQIKDSLHEIDKATRYRFARIAYETDEIADQNTLLQQRNLFLFIIIIAVCLFIVVLFFIFRLKMKNKELRYKQEEQEKIDAFQQLLLQQQTLTEAARDQERKRIAQDLHDTILNRIFTTKVNLINLEVTDDVKKNSLITELSESYKQIREVSHRLYNDYFSPEQNFSLFLEKLVLSQKNTFQTHFKATIGKNITWDSFDMAQKTSIYLIIQELLQNVNKHSNAQNCSVFVIKVESTLIIRIHDDGVGFQAHQKSKGLGYISINDRLSQLKGKLSKMSKKGNTMVSVEIPMV